jgi:Domain of unknown function (DUF222)/HNH endonuclease
MFEDSRRVDPTVTFPALAAAITDIPLRPERSNPALTVEARALLMLRRQLDARLLSRVAAVDDQGLACGDGFASTAAWIRGYANLDSGQATSMVKAARIADRLPLLGDVLAAGTIGVEHLQAVAAGAKRVPFEVLVEHDHTLRDLAPHARPAEMRRAAAKLQACHDEDSVAKDAAHVHDSRYLTVSRTFGDAYHLDGLLEPEAGAALVTALDALTPRRGTEDTRSLGQRRADALTELTELGLRSGKLPDLGGDRPRLTLLVQVPTAAALPEDPVPAGRTEAVEPACRVTALGAGDRVLIGTDALIPAETVRRLTCCADISLATVNEWGEPLNLYLTSRFPNVPQRRALVIRDGGCVFPGCDRPPAHCQVHHIRYWSAGGPTNLDNLALICWFHHHLLHEGGWRLERIPPRAGSTGHPPQPPGWLATAADGRQLRELRQPAA